MLLPSNIVKNGLLCGIVEGTITEFQLGSERRKGETELIEEENYTSGFDDYQFMQVDQNGLNLQKLLEIEMILKYMRCPTLSQ